MSSILIVSDSRGKGLKPLLDPPLGYTIDFVPKNWATLEETVNIVRCKLFRKNPTVTCIYILTGICSVTEKCEQSISLPYDTKEELVELVTSKIGNTRIGNKKIDDITTIPTVLCTFPGVDLIRANNKNATGIHPQQELLNEGMIDINDFIVDLNLTRGFSTPMLSAAIHRCHQRRKDGTKKYRHHYSRLDDGIHPTASTLQYWKKRLEEDFAQFAFDFEQL